MARFTVAASSLALVAGSVLLASCVHDEGSHTTAPVGEHHEIHTVATPSLDDTMPIHMPGLHNVVAYHDDFYSGSAPESDEGFDTLAAMGIRTIISVDGAVPEVDKAKAHGIRYIHLPIGYNGFDEQRKLELVRASRDALAEGPVYVHCHHGKHRSAGAAAAIASSLGWLTPDEAVERMHVSGTSSSYQGLYTCALESEPISDDRINLVPASFPEVSTPGSFVQGMVDIDIAVEHLKEIEKAGWKVPADHPDLVPAAEAGKLADLYRLLNDVEYKHNDSIEFVAWMDEAHTHSQQLEDMIVDGSSAELLSRQFDIIKASCTDCHAVYRNQR
ncbi:MAG: hypothetical protein H6815_11560 [Phycisphaeraceae bacterium]|nr:hypothetical protein [Phycisphaerales bacterium]MCB9861075.1 hypothetical protein [Phycisphaeraceae bacterium]